MTEAIQERLVRGTPFGRYLTARTLAQVGSGITYIALPVLAYRISDSPSAPALVAACETAPYIVLGPIAGALGDRWNRRTLMVATDLLGAVAIALLLIVHHVGSLSVAQVIGTAFVLASLQVTFDGAAFGAVPALVGRDRIGEANSRLWSAMSVVDTALPAITGTMLAFIYPANLVSSSTLTFLLSAWLISSLVIRAPADAHHLPKLGLNVLASEVMEGFRFLSQHAGIRTMTLISSLQCFALGGLLAMLVPLADQRLDIGTSGPRFGGLYAAYGLGGLFASLLLPYLLAKASTQRIAAWTVPLLVLVQVGLILSAQWVLAAAFIMLWSAGWTVTMLAAVTYRQHETPDRLQGRVNTVGRMLAAGIGTTGGTLLAGVAVERAGITATLVMTCTVGALAVPLALKGPRETLESSELGEPSASE